MDNIQNEEIRNEEIQKEEIHNEETQEEEARNEESQDEEALQENKKISRPRAIIPFLLSLGSLPFAVTGAIMFMIYGTAKSTQTLIFGMSDTAIVCYFGMALALCATVLSYRIIPKRNHRHRGLAKAAFVIGLISALYLVAVVIAALLMIILTVAK